MWSALLMYQWALEFLFDAPRWRVVMALVCFCVKNFKKKKKKRNHSNLTDITLHMF